MSKATLNEEAINAYEEAEELNEEKEVSNEELALKAELDKKDEELAKLKDSYLRATADFENYKKRLEKDKQNAVLYAQEGLLKDLLPVLDALDMAKFFEADDEFSKQLKQGIENTLTLFSTILEKHGIKEIDAKTGDDFNHEIHECMMNQESAEYEANKILQVFQKGYTLNDRIIRACKVIISK